jgi:hypothetical protein
MADEPAVKNAIAFIDGQNLCHHAKAAFGHHHPNYDPIKLHKAVCEARGWRPTLVRFYSGIPSVADNEMWGGYWVSRILSMKRAHAYTVSSGKLGRARFPGSAFSS